MANTPCTANVRPTANFAQVNVRTGPTTSTGIAFRADVGLTSLPILDVQPDAQGASFQGKVFQWFKLQFPDGQTGWIRDDLLELQGGCGEFGYGELSVATRAFSLTRGSVYQEDSELERIRKAAFNITAAFEGAGYGSYQNFDAGIVSYGRFQFTLASGNLATLINLYLRSSQSDTAELLRILYLDRILRSDEALRHESQLRTLLQQAANEPAMQAAQDQLATSNFWMRAYNNIMLPRAIDVPLSMALIFDMTINHGFAGTEQTFLALTEETLQLPPRVRLDEVAYSEYVYVQRLADVRRDRLYLIANRRNLPGLKPRGDFWVNLIQRADWLLHGDAEGMVEVKQGARVQVRNP